MIYTLSGYMLNALCEVEDYEGTKCSRIRKPTLQALERRKFIQRDEGGYYRITYLGGEVLDSIRSE